MSLVISVTDTVDVSGPETEGRVLARYAAENDTLWIYPQGIGYGPVLAMSKADWGRLKYEVAMAMSRADDRSRFIATEGNGDAL